MLDRRQQLPRLRPVRSKRERLLQLTTCLGKIRRAAEETRELQVRLGILGVLPDARPEEAFLAQSLLHRADKWGVKRRGSRPIQTPRQLRQRRVAGDPQRIDILRLGELPPCLLIATQPLQRLTIQIPELGIARRQRDRL